MFFAFWGDKVCVRGEGYSLVVSNSGGRVCSYGGDSRWGDVLECGNVSVGGDDVEGSGGIGIGGDGVVGPNNVTVDGVGDVVGVEGLPATGVAPKSSGETFREAGDRDEVYGFEGWHSRLQFRPMFRRCTISALIFHINVKSDVSEEYVRILLPHPTKVK